jgi:hypothetical protein
VKEQLELLAESYRSESGRSWNHFFCPILMVDEENVELCDGHITPDKTGGTITVPQRKDVDNFLGSSVQSLATAWATAQDLNEVELLADSSVYYSLGARVSLDSKEYKVFPVGDKSPNSLPSDFTKLLVETPKTKVWFGIEVSPMEAEGFSADTLLTVTNAKDPSCGIIATLIHSAHLLMFKLQGYKYVFSCSGQATAQLLRDFYSACCSDGKTTSKLKAQELAREHFYPYRHTCRQMSFVPDLLGDTLKTNVFLLLLDLDDQPFARGVAIRMGSTTNLVLLPEDTVSGVIKFEQFRKSPHQNIRYRLVKYDAILNRWQSVSDVHCVAWPGEEFETQLD